ncbi:MAG: hypothetical protein RL340_444, partial [Gemmatimonadota bacterium]
MVRAGGVHSSTGASSSRAEATRG